MCAIEAFLLSFYYIAVKPHFMNFASWSDTQTCFCLSVSVSMLLRDGVVPLLVRASFLMGLFKGKRDGELVWTRTLRQSSFDMILKLMLSLSRESSSLFYAFSVQIPKEYLLVIYRYALRSEGREPSGDRDWSSYSYSCSWTG